MAELAEIVENGLKKLKELSATSSAVVVADMCSSDEANTGWSNLFALANKCQVKSRQNVKSKKKLNNEISLSDHALKFDKNIVLEELKKTCDNRIFFCCF